MIGTFVLDQEQLGVTCRGCNRQQAEEPGPLSGVWPVEMLAEACWSRRWESTQRAIVGTMAWIEEARIQVQKWFPFGLGPAFGDGMPSPDGGGDLLQALVDVFAGATSPLGPRWPACP
ncbi:hypothetical protein [Kitasatospora cineracea]|uniref:Uncharacterized protein n=1 Tax=Kitasatospora cineracea TaxID=88074 RepID=A0A3N4R5S2_9ACTN|nr:hypothetical protein [Kitasatospora cineracea]RPE27966.1 hypothetical protein EDD38_7266 [Kitasatospora cineracea]